MWALLYSCDAGWDLLCTSSASSVYFPLISDLDLSNGLVDITSIEKG
jgi:hypothetical protein